MEEGWSEASRREWCDGWKRGKEGKQSVEEGWSEASREKCFDGEEGKGREEEVEWWNEGLQRGNILPGGEGNMNRDKGRKKGGLKDH